MMLDVNPLEIVSGGTDADGNLVGFDFDGIIAKPPFRADAVVYFKNDYAEYRKADGAGSYTPQTVDGVIFDWAFSATGSPFGNPAREIRIRWADLPGISARPNSFNWCGYQYSTSNFIFNELPSQNPDGIQSTPYFPYYFTVSNTSNSGTTNPFSQTSFEWREPFNFFFGEDATYNLYDLTNNSANRIILERVDPGNVVVNIQNKLNTSFGIEVKSAENLNMLNRSKFIINTGGFLETSGGGNINYNRNSTLQYNTGTTFGRGAEWSSTSGSGYPGNVEITGNTTLNISNSAPTIPRQIAKDLKIESGSKLSMEDMVEKLTVLGSADIQGELELSSAIGGDFEIEQQLDVGGTLTANDREVIMNNDIAVGIEGNLTLPYLRINSNTGVDVNFFSGNVLRITKRLSLDNGYLSTIELIGGGNSLVLESTNTETAMIVDNGGTISGATTVERFITEGVANSYHIITSPVVGEEVSDLATDLTGGSLTITHPYSLSALGSGANTNPFPNLFLYQDNLVRTGFESTDFGWETPANSSVGLTAGKGFLARMPLNSTMSFVGTPNTGDITVDISNANGLANSGWNMIGNPYPAPIDWDDVVGLAENSAIFDDGLGGGQPVANAVYIARPMSSYGAVYGSYINGTASGGFNASGLIPAMQGFFVRRTEASGTSTITFKNSVRETDYVNPTFQRTKNEKKGLLRLEIQSDLVGANRKDDLVIYFQDGATADFDGSFDAFKFSYNPVGFPTIFTKAEKGEDKLAISAFRPWQVLKTKQ